MISLLRISALLASVVSAAAIDPIVRRTAVPKGLQLQRSISSAGRVKGLVRKSQFLPNPFADTCTDSQIGGNYVDSAKNQAFVLNQTDCAVTFSFGAHDAAGGIVTHDGTVSKDANVTTVSVYDWGANGTVQANGDVQFSDSSTGEATRHWTKQHSSKKAGSATTAAGASSAATPAPATADATAVAATTAAATAATTAAPPAVTTADASSAVTTAAATDQTGATTIIPIVVPAVVRPPNSVPIEWAAVPLTTAAPDGTVTDAPETTAASGEGEGEGEATTTSGSGGGWFW